MDHILYWNEIALEANQRDFSNPEDPTVPKPPPEQGGPTLSSRAMAIVHLAMYDAHAAIVGGPDLPRYLSGSGIPTPKPGANAAAAVAAAAHSCLSNLYPRQKNHFLAAHQNAGLSGAGLKDGHDFGLAVAQYILKDRKDDGTPSDDGYAPPMHPGMHRPDPANPNQGYHAPFYGDNTKSFAIPAASIPELYLDLDPDYQIGGAEYQRALDQVRIKGIAPELMGTLPEAIDNNKRNVDETVIGLFWAYDGPRKIGTPPRLYNQIVRDVAKKTINPSTGKVNTVDENARLFALVNAAMGDAGILAWKEKYKHNVWRPVLGIREHDSSMGPTAPTATNPIDNDCDTMWLPLGAPMSNSYDPKTGRGEKNFTPPFPAYPSGHATFGAAALHVTRLFYGIPEGDRKKDNLLGSFISDELNGVNQDNQGNVRPRHDRKFNDGLWQMIIENGLSRVYLGVHWSFDAFALDKHGKPDLSKHRIGGVPLGLKVAEAIFKVNKKGPARPS